MNSSEFVLRSLDPSGTLLSVVRTCADGVARRSYRIRDLDQPGQILPLYLERRCDLPGAVAMELIVRSTSGQRLGLHLGKVTHQVIEMFPEAKGV